MGTIPYNFLVDSVLFNDKEIDNSYDSLSDNEIDKVLQDYREYCLKNISEMTSEITRNKSSLKVLSSLEKTHFDTLKQSALYFDQFIIYDPLFKFTQIENETSKVITKYLGFDKKGINRKELVSTVKFLKAITPMIAADFVKILPLSYNFEPSKNVEVNIPINYYAEILPSEILEYFKNKAIVKSMDQVNGAWRILDKNDLTPGLFITFDNLNENTGSIFHYFEQVVDETEDPTKYLSRIKLAKSPMDKSIWDAWVFQSVNSSAKAVFDKIYIENLIANELKATYLTDNIFTTDLLINNLSAKETVETSSATQFMNLELPFLDNVDIDKLMTIRLNEADIFTNFRIELERQFRELRLINDPKEIKLRQENILHELGDIQLKKINQKLAYLKQKGFVDAVLLIGGLGGVVQTAGWSLLSTALAAVSGYKTYQEYKEKIVDNPSYLLWKVVKK